MSPQSIVAVKSPVSPSGFASVKVATFPLNACSETAGVAQLAVNAASATSAVDVTVPWFAGKSVSVTVTVTV